MSREATNNTRKVATCISQSAMSTVTPQPTDLLSAARTATQVKGDAPAVAPGGLTSR